MRVKTRRTNPRQKCVNTEAAIGNRRGNLADVSRSGAFITNVSLIVPKLTVGQKCKVILSPSEGQEIVREGQVARAGFNGTQWYAIKFASELNSFHIDCCTGNMERRYDRRAAERVDVKELRLEANLGGLRCFLVDIGKWNAFVDLFSHSPEDFPPTHTRIIINLPRRRPIERDVEIVRKDGGRPQWCAVKFKIPLSVEELKLVQGAGHALHGIASDSVWEVVASDRKELHAELRDIKSCRSTLFLWTIGGLSPAMLAVWTFAIEDKLTMPATLAATALMLGFFAVGMMGILEKVRATHEREGLVAALDFYLRRERVPRGYCGWTELKHCLSECVARRRQGKCPRSKDAVDTCQSEAHVEAAAFNSFMRLFPSPLSSFTSLSTTVLGLFYLLLVASFSVALAGAGNSLREVPPIPLWGCFAAGLFLSAVLGRTRVLIAGVAAGFISSLVVGVIVPENLWAYITGVTAGTLIGSLGWFFIRRLWDCRVGRFSRETYQYTWHAILENCAPLPRLGTRDQVYVETNNIKNAFNSLTRWFLSRKSHGYIVDKYEEMERESRESHTVTD